MKKKLALVFAVICIAFSIFASVVAMQPAEFRIARSTVIKAEPEKVFPLINNVHIQSEWSPWNEYDPKMKKNFEGPEAGVGASQSWDGNDQVGSGKLTIVKAEPNKQVKLKLEFFKPMESTNEAIFALNAKEGGTEVEWSMTGNKSYIEKAFCMFMDMDKMVGGDFEKGLRNLKERAERS